MTASAEPARTRTGRRHCIGARSAVFLLWVVVVVSAELILLLAVQDKSTRATTSRSVSSETSDKIGATTTSSDRSAAGSVKSLPRKAKMFHAVAVHAPSNPSSDEVANANGDPDKVYEEDKRIIHTGPNPLHN